MLPPLKKALIIRNEEYPGPNSIKKGQSRDGQDNKIDKSEITIGQKCGLDNLLGF